MEVRHSTRGIEWLKDALQAAIELELTTIPPYLCALWSIEDGTDPFALSIREVVHEEMMHMGIACNLLTAIEANPKLTGMEATPIYPGPLPGGVKQNISLSLSGLCRKSVQVFADIEAPQTEAKGSSDGSDGHPSVAAFYTAILEVFERLQPTLSTDKQLVGPLAPLVVRDISEVRAAIELIIQQGEGTTSTPIDTGPDDLAHYFRFMEMLKGRRLVCNEGCAEWKYEGERLPWPRAYLMKEVPRGGYEEADIPSNVWRKLCEFDVLYSTLLRRLEGAWKMGDLGRLIRSVETMFSMRDCARSLMRIPIGNTPETYGPCFRYVEE